MDSLIHGGDLDYIAKYFNKNINDLIDFSSNINPLGLSQNIKNILLNNINIIETYPDKNYAKLKNCIAVYTNTNHNHILVGNGSTEMLSIFFNILKPKNALLLAPSYSEYERNLKNIGCNISFFYLKEEEDFIINLNELLENIKNKDLLVICNPNNPTGSAIYIDKIKLIAQKCQKENCYLIHR